MTIDMMPGMRGMNPRQMKQAMKKMGISTDEIDGVEEVIIRTSDKEYVISNASVTVMTVQGQRNYQVIGDEEVRTRGHSSDIKEPGETTIPNEDVELVISQTGCDRAAAIKALEATSGQPAEAIIHIISG